MVASRHPLLHVQLAVLYTDNRRRRLVRVHNLSMRATSNHTAIFRSADLDVVAATILQQVRIYIYIVFQSSHSQSRTLTNTNNPPHPNPLHCRPLRRPCACLSPWTMDREIW